MNTTMKHTSPRKTTGILILALVAALIALAVILVLQANDECPEYELTIKELGSESMLVHSTSEELGYGEILLVYGRDMTIEDINGQVIDLSELSVQDAIRVSLLPQEKADLEPIISKIVLLPDDSDDYV